MGKSRLVGLAMGIVCLALALSGCVDQAVDDHADTSGGGLGSATPQGDNGDRTYSAPQILPGPAIFVALNSPFTAYNNRTRDTNSEDNRLVLNQVLASPFVVDGNGNYLLNSDVMASAELTSKDPQVVTYKIKPNIKWSDGEPWNCRDFYLAWLAGSGKAVARGPGGNVIQDAKGKDVSYFASTPDKGAERSTGECRDDLTFVETYSAPYVDWRRNYVQNAILPAHVLERQTGIPDVTALTPQSSQSDLKKAGDFWNTGWVGFNDQTMPASGAYRIASSSPGGGPTVLERNEKWAGNPGGPDRLVFTPVPDGAAAVQGLQNQEFSIVTPAVDPVLADRLRGLANQGVVFVARGGNTIENLNINVARPLLQDPVVRAAFAQCVDRNELVDRLVRGVLPQAQPLSSEAFLADDPNYQDVYSDKMPADSRKAQQTLEKAGWVLSPDGVYYRGGERLSFAIANDGSPAHALAVQLIRTQCRQAGMEITDGATSPARFRDALAKGTFDVALTENSPIPRVSSMVDRYESTGPLNHRNYNNPGVDDALGVAETQYDESTQTKALRKADQLIANDLVSLPLYQVPIMWSYSNTISNVYRNPFDGITWNANEWQVS